MTNYIKSDVKQVYAVLCVSLPCLLLLLIQDNARLFHVHTSHRLSWSSSELVFYFTAFSGLLPAARLISRLGGADFTCAVAETIVTGLSVLCEQMAGAVEVHNVHLVWPFMNIFTFHSHLSNNSFWFAVSA